MNITNPSNAKPSNKYLTTDLPKSSSTIDDDNSNPHRYIVKYRDGFSLMNAPILSQSPNETTLKLLQSNAEVVLISSNEEFDKIKNDVSVEFIERGMAMFYCCISGKQ